MSQSGYSIHNLVQEAKTRWLKPAEIFFILQNYTEDQITHTSPQKPAAGSLFLFNKRVLRFFRKDGHSWRKKKDGKTVGEAHERLKVGNSEALNCYYAHGEQNPNFQRRSFWMLDPAFEHIVLVHYRDISEGTPSSGSVSKLSTGSPSTFSQSQSFYTATDPGSTTVITEYQSPESVEVNSDAVFKGNGTDYTDRIERNEETSSSSELEVSQALRRLEVQLSLNDDSLEEVGQFGSLNGNSSNSDYIFSDQCRSTTSQENLNNLLLQRSDDDRRHDNQGFGQQLTMDPKGFLSWKDMLEVNTSSPGAEYQENALHPNGNGMLLSHSRNYLLEEQERRRWTNFDGHSGQEYNDSGTANNNSTQKIEASNKSLSMFEASLPSQATSLVPLEVEDFKFPAYSPSTSLQPNDPYYTTLLDQSRNGMYLEAATSLTIAQKQKFTIREICPEWSFSTESTKVVIVGSFLCDPSQDEWTCMFGDIEVPLQIIQEGVLCCSTPLHFPGKVTLCITSGNRESCSEVREFEYRVKPSNYDQCSSSQQESTKSPEELLLLVRLVQMLLTDPSVNKGVPTESGQDLLGISKADDDSWGHVIEALLVGNWTSSSTTDWVLQELLKDKLQHWLLSRAIEGAYQPDCSLSKREQSVIHMIAGLGFVWALNPILNAGVSINFRDINGWTALHWAAQFGRLGESLWRGGISEVSAWRSIQHIIYAI